MFIELIVGLHPCLHHGARLVSVLGIFSLTLCVWGATFSASVCFQLVVSFEVSATLSPCLILLCASTPRVHCEESLFVKPYFMGVATGDYCTVYGRVVVSFDEYLRSGDDCSLLMTYMDVFLSVIFAQSPYGFISA